MLSEPVHVNLARSIAVVTYVGTTWCIIAKTFNEGRRAGDGWGMMRVAGLTLCLVWPAVLAAIALRLVIGLIFPKTTASVRRLAITPEVRAGAGSDGR